MAGFKKPVLVGNIFNDRKDRFEDGKTVHTTAIKSREDREDGTFVARTLNSTYLVYPMGTHRLATHENCDRPHCPICEGGLAFCETCRGAEASLPTECPGRKMTEEEEEGVMAGIIDFTWEKGWMRR